MTGELQETAALETKDLVLENESQQKGRDVMDGLLEDKQESELSASLSPSIYSIIFVCSVKSQAFYVAFLIFFFQVTFPIVVLMDLINTSATGVPSTLSVPAGINTEVRIAGFLSLALSVPYFSDTLDAVEKLQEGYDPVVTKQSPDATRWYVPVTYGL